jgi:hypothetical protein
MVAAGLNVVMLGEGLLPVQIAGIVAMPIAATLRRQH